MRDRLEELQQRAQDFSEAASEDANPFSAEGNDDDSVVVGVITPQAVVFEEEPIIENFLSEAQQIRDDITVLETEVIVFFLLLFVFCCRNEYALYLLTLVALLLLLIFMIFFFILFGSTFEVLCRTFSCFSLSLIIFFLFIIFFFIKLHT